MKYGSFILNKLYKKLIFYCEEKKFLIIFFGLIKYLIIFFGFVRYLLLKFENDILENLFKYNLEGVVFKFIILLNVIFLLIL